MSNTRYMCENCIKQTSCKLYDEVRFGFIRALFFCDGVDTGRKQYTDHQQKMESKEVE